LGVGVFISTMTVLAILFYRRRRRIRGNADRMWRGLSDGGQWSHTDSSTNPNFQGRSPGTDAAAAAARSGGRRERRGRLRGTAGELEERDLIPEKMSAPPRAELDAGFPVGAYCDPADSISSSPHGNGVDGRAAEHDLKVHDFYGPPIELSTTEPGMEREVAGASRAISPAGVAPHKAVSKYDAD
jgi:hypothetical protein